MEYHKRVLNVRQNIRRCKLYDAAKLLNSLSYQLSDCSTVSVERENEFRLQIRNSCELLKTRLDTILCGCIDEWIGCSISESTSSVQMNSIISTSNILGHRVRDQSNVSVDECLLAMIVFWGCERVVEKFKNHIYCVIGNEICGCIVNGEYRNMGSMPLHLLGNDGNDERLTELIRNKGLEDDASKKSVSNKDSDDHYYQEHNLLSQITSGMGNWCITK